MVHLLDRGIDAETAYKVAEGTILKVHPAVRSHAATQADRFNDLLVEGLPVYGATTEVAAQLVPASARWLTVDAAEDHVANATLAAHRLWALAVELADA